MTSKERPPRPFAAIPISVLDGPAFQGLSDRAAKLLVEAVRQHNGNNNGHFQLTDAWLTGRGWRSKDGMLRARQELLASGLIVQTRKGGRTKASLYAVTWLPVANPAGLDSGYDNGNSSTPPHGVPYPAPRGTTTPPHGVQAPKKPQKRTPPHGVYVETVRARGAAAGTGGRS